MTALAAALWLALVPQDEAKLKESWPKLVDAWKAVEGYKPAPEAGPLDDEYLKVVAKIHGAFEAAGLFVAEGEYLPQAMKAFVKCRARGLSPAAARYLDNRIAVIRRVRVAGGAPGVWESGTPTDSDPMGALLN